MAAWTGASSARSTTSGGSSTPPAATMRSATSASGVRVSRTSTPSSSRCTTSDWCRAGRHPRPRSKPCDAAPASSRCRPATSPITSRSACAPRSASSPATTRRPSPSCSAGPHSPASPSSSIDRSVHWTSLPRQRRPPSPTHPSRCPQRRQERPRPPTDPATAARPRQSRPGPDTSGPPSAGETAHATDPARDRRARPRPRQRRPEGATDPATNILHHIRALLRKGDLQLQLGRVDQANELFQDTHARLQHLADDAPSERVLNEIVLLSRKLDSISSRYHTH